MGLLWNPPLPQINFFGLHNQQSPSCHTLQERQFHWCDQKICVSCCPSRISRGQIPTPQPEGMAAWDPGAPEVLVCPLHPPTHAPWFQSIDYQHGMLCHLQINWTFHLFIHSLMVLMKVVLKDHVWILCSLLVELLEKSGGVIFLEEVYHWAWVFSMGAEQGLFLPSGGGSRHELSQLFLLSGIMDSIPLKP